MIEEDFPVAPLSNEGSTTISADDLIASEISSNFFGVGSPEIFADVDTIGRPNLDTSC